MESITTAKAIKKVLSAGCKAPKKITRANSKDFEIKVSVRGCFPRFKAGK